MKKTLTVIGLLIFIGCNSKQDLPKEKTEDIAALYVMNGRAEVGWLKRLTQVSTIEDSTTKKVKLVIDTLWAIPRVFNVFDSLGKLKLDSLKRPITQERYIQISKDSLEWRIENKHLPDLVKERFSHLKN